MHTLKSSTNLVVAALIPLSGGLVIVQRNYVPGVGKWCFPCGKLEGQEGMDAAVAREAREESGLEVTVAGFVYSYHIPCTELEVFIKFAIPRGGELRAGGDAVSVRVLTRFDLDVTAFAFPQHKEIARQWFNRTLPLVGVNLSQFRIA